MSAPASGRAGFSLVELVIAIVILSIGMLALAAGSGYTTVELRSSALRTQRAAVISSTIEQIRARASTPDAFDALTSVPASSAITVGAFKVWYQIDTDLTVSGVVFTRRITVYTLGPQYRPKVGWTATGQDAFVTVLYRPLR